jgi:hypothetical protein
MPWNHSDDSQESLPSRCSCIDLKLLANILNSEWSALEEIVD